MEQRIKDLFATAVELPVTERYRFLAGLPTEDRRLREELARLLEADVKNGCGIIDAVEEAAQSLLDQDGVIGSRIGAYRIMDEIGRGGMGTVYLAVRDDDHYEKQVAIKVIRRGMDTDDMLHRFRNERQVLANLDHPYIASLLDGGAAPDGRPFLVMEFVRGAPLDVYCNEEKLDLRGRCRLFLKVCEAVAFAHRNLIVHRDLKPGNILVSNDGVPKLLDFGLSKLLNGESGGRTTVTARPVTPEFASPEMIRAEQITTAADVYSLGAILYELLSGERAHRFVSQGFREVERVVCEVEPPLPSARAQTFRRQLQGDLDAIISMAMRKEPAARYATVDQFAADIERYLNGWPVTARHGDLAYRTRKFLRRNRAAIAVGGLLAGTLIAGATIASIEAKHAAREQIRAEQQRQRAVESQTRAEASQREAEHQRQFAEEQRRQADWQRVTAETQRQLADRRFQQVRQLANKFLLEFHDSIAKLPGSTPARKMVVETGLRYYDTLVKEADRGTNRELLGEIAQGYTRLGDVQGNPYYASLGDLDGALASYRKALALREKISDSTAESVADHMRARVKVAQLLTVKGEVENAVSTLQAAIRSGEQFQTALAVKEALAQAYVAEGDLWNRTGDHAKSIEPYLKHLTLRKEMAQAHPGSPVSDISLAHTKLGDSYARLGRAEDALPHFRIVLPIDQKLAEGDPNSMPRLRKLYVDYFLLGFVIRSNPGLDYSEFGGERAVMETATKIAARMAAADPENSAVHLDVLGSESSLGDWLRNHSEFDEALIHYRKALAAAARHAGGGPPSLSSYDALIQANHRMASGLREAGQFEESLQYFRIAEEYLTKAEEKNPGLKRFAKRHAEIASGRGRVYQSRGEWKRAIDNFETSIAIFEKSRAKGGPEGEEAVVLQVPLYGMLANCYAALEEWQNAIRSAQCSLSRLEEIAKRRPLLAHEESQRKESMAKLEKWGPQTQR